MRNSSCSVWKQYNVSAPVVTKKVRVHFVVSKCKQQPNNTPTILVRIVICYRELLRFAWRLINRVKRETITDK